jgi:hypothetical protein
LLVHLSRKEIIVSQVQRLRAYWPAAVLAALLLVAGITLAGSLRAQEGPPSPTGIDASSAALGSGFAFQGQVADDGGNPIDGACDLRFDLYNAASGGSKVGEANKPNQPVADGLFAVQLDFGTAEFRGDARWLELAARCPAGSGTYKTLSPRQELSAVPYALSLRPGADVVGSVPAGGNFDAGLRVVNNSPNYPIAIFGISSATGGPAIGVAGNNSSPDGWGVSGYSFPSGIGVRGEAPEGTGVHGLAQDGTGVLGVAVNGTGVWGSSTAWVGTFGYSEQYQGVRGESGTGAGVVGDSVEWIGTYGESTNYVGVWGQSVASTGVRGFSQSGVGVHGSSTTGLAALFDGRTSTQILEITGGSDLAERFEVSGGVAVEPGTVMIIDADNPGHLTPATTAYDRKVAGVVSGAGDVETGLVLHQEGVLEGETVVAIAGRVYVRAEAVSGPIAPGDMLTTSDMPGYVMVAADHDRAQGAVIGKAMTGLERGTGLVLVLINLQ